MKRLIKLSIWTLVVLCIALSLGANRKNQVTISVQNATAQPILNIQVFHTGIAFETGPLRPGESKSFKFEPKNEGGYSLVIQFSSKRHTEIAVGYVSWMQEEDSAKIYDEYMEYAFRQHFPLEELWRNDFTAKKALYSLADGSLLNP